MHTFNWIQLDDPACRNRLIDIALLHTRLALEFSQAGVSLERRAQIKLEIDSLRRERGDLLKFIMVKK